MNKITQLKSVKLGYMLLITLILCGLSGPVLSAWAAADNTTDSDSGIGESLVPPLETKITAAKGRVIEKTVEKQESFAEYGVEYHHYRISILTGSHKGKMCEATQETDNASTLTFEADVGDVLLLEITEDNAGDIAFVTITEISRQNTLLALVILFLIVLIGCGWLKGLKTVITLALTVLAIAFVILPCLHWGKPPIPVTIAVCAVVTTATLLIVSGINLKSLAAILGTTCGVVIAGVIAMVFGHFARLSGLEEQNVQLLARASEGIVDFKGLLFSGIIIGALGAVMDVGMSIASSLNEMKQLRPDLSKMELMKAGMNVGRDIMGTMSNTLILAYTGSSMPLLLLFMASDISFSEYINWGFIATEVIRALAGSIGLILTIPITTVICACLFQLQKAKPEKTSKEKSVQ